MAVAAMLKMAAAAMLDGGYKVLSISQMICY